MPVEIIDCVAVGNAGDGFRIRGDVEIRGCKAISNLGEGFRIEDESLISSLGLPSDTDPKQLLDWLVTINQQPENTREEIVVSSTFWEKVGKVAPPLSITSSLLGIANSPTFHQIILALSSLKDEILQTK